jgi:hypothetical protein
MGRFALALLLTTGVAACGQPQAAPPPDGGASGVAPALASAPSSAPAATPSSAPSSTASSAPSSAPAATPSPTLHVLAHTLVIHLDATLKSHPIGTLATGDSVALRDEPPRAGPGCAAWRGVVPRGWVCADGDAVTFDADDPTWVALRAHAPDYTSPWPYAYGESKGARRHKTLPGLDAPAWPAALFDPHVEIPRRSTIAWLDEVDAEGGPFLRADDMTFVRKDRVLPFERSDFAGVHLSGADGAALPLAFFKRGPHTRYARDAGGKLAPTGSPWPRLAWVGLTGQTEKHGAHAFWETREAGVWIDARDAAIVSPDPAAAPPGPHPTWIEVAALQGWLVAYEGDRPVFATLISAGKLGAARPDPDEEPHQPPATTPLGTFRIREKLVTATLQSDLDDGTEFVHAHVPWSQRFYDKYLLHTAYWHDQWGEGHSGGCVNLAPIDAKWLFEWTEPRVPEGWHSVRAADGDDAPATVVVIHV